MPLLRIQRYKTVASDTVTDYFLTVGSYDANNEPVVCQLNPALFTSLGDYAVIRTTGEISNLASPIGPPATWTSAHPLGYSVSAPLLGNAIIGGTPYNVIYVTVSA
jgi:hypothetical protein